MIIDKSGIRSRGFATGARAERASRVLRHAAALIQQTMQARLPVRYTLVSLRRARGASALKSSNLTVRVSGPTRKCIA